MRYATVNTATIPLIINSIKTLKRIMHISKKFIDCDFSFVLLQNFNQNQIENFFVMESEI